MIIIKIIFLYFIQIRHTDDFPSTGTRLVQITTTSHLSTERPKGEQPTKAEEDMCMYACKFCEFAGDMLVSPSLSHNTHTYVHAPNILHGISYFLHRHICYSA